VQYKTKVNQQPNGYTGHYILYHLRAQYEGDFERLRGQTENSESHVKNEKQVCDSSLEKAQKAKEDSKAKEDGKAWIAKDIGGGV
jgi:hypothetical protein